MRHRFISKAPNRLDKLIAEHTDLSRRRVKGLIQRGCVFVDGQVVKFEGARIANGAVITVKTSGPAKPIVLVECFRQHGVLVLNKPSGVPTQGTRQNTEHHLYASVCAQEHYVGLHHRLDTPASGLVLFTLDPNLNAPISTAFRTDQIQRRYLVVVVGEVPDRGCWDSKIDGKSSITHWTRLAGRAGLSVIEAELQTGRTHQIRRHAASMGFPIVGDRRYGGAAGKLWPRLGLHAHCLRFEHPVTRKDVTVKCPPPPDLTDLLTQAGWAG